MSFVAISNAARGGEPARDASVQWRARLFDRVAAWARWTKRVVTEDQTHTHSRRSIPADGQ